MECRTCGKPILYANEACCWVCGCGKRTTCFPMEFSMPDEVKKIFGSLNEPPEPNKKGKDD